MRREEEKRFGTVGQYNNVSKASDSAEERPNEQRGADDEGRQLIVFEGVRRRSFETPRLVDQPWNIESSGPVTLALMHR